MAARTFLLAIAAFSCASASAQASVPASVPAETLFRGWLQPPLRPAKVPKGNLPVRALPEASAAAKERLSSTLEAADRLFERNAAVALLLIEPDGAVLFERYKQGAGADDAFLGFSMTKSLTSILLGNALCEGRIASLSDPAERYADVLKGTAYGAASIEQLLTMSSGGDKSLGGAGQPVPSWSTDVLRKQTTDLREGFKRFGSGGAQAATPSKFTYKGMDTQAVAAVVAAATGERVEAYASKVVWQKIGAEADASWLTDRNGDASAAEGFGARARDWARLALYVRDQVSGLSESCLSRYLKSATTKRIGNDSGEAPALRGYGYQFWTDGWRAKSVYWMAGYAGQRIGIDRTTGRVLVLFSSIENFIPEVEFFMDRWAGQDR